MNPATTAIGYFPDPLIGKPISEGYIYVGEPDTDPTVPANQKTMTVLEEDGSKTVVAQPLRTNAGGTPTYNGSPVTLLVEIPFSLTVLRKTLSQAYYVPSISSGDIIGDVKAADGTTVLDSGTDGTDATFIGDVKAVDGTTILDSGTDGTDASFTGKSTGDHIGQVQADDLTMVLDPGADGSAVLLNATGISGTAIKDEDTMSSDSATHMATQQSIKAYADSVSILPNGSEAFTASGTFNVPAKVYLVFVDMSSGGGGGGGSINSGSWAGGGAGGRQMFGYPHIVTPAAALTVTIGAGGAGGAGTSSDTGSTGGTTVFDTISLGGSVGGTGSNAGATAGGVAALGIGHTGDGGAGATPGGGTALFSGGTGSATTGGGGGATLFGTGGNGTTGAGGSAGANTGGGGAGGANGAAGGSGGSGKVIVRW